MALEQKDFKSRRRVPRRNFDAAVGLLLQGKYAMVRSFQVGEGGMMISSPLAIREGTQVVVTFFLTAHSLIMVRGVVRSVVKAQGSTPERYGLEFLNLGFHHKREIRNFVAAATRTENAGASF